MKSAKRILLLASLGLLMSCSDDNKVTPSSTISSREYAAEGYNQLSVEDTFSAEVEFTDQLEQVVVEANDNLFQYISVRKEQNMLIIEFDDKISIEGGNATLNVYISTDFISDYWASGASSITLKDTVGSSNFEVHLSGASAFKGTLMGGNLNASATGASTLMLDGTANKFTSTLTGASGMQGYGFVVDWFHGDLSGASTAMLTANTKLDVWASGASTVYYKGDGVVDTQELSDASQIIKVE